MTYAQLTLPRGRGYSPMIKQAPAQRGTVYAKIDHSRSFLGGILSPTSATSASAVNNSSTHPRTRSCFSGPLLTEEAGDEGEEVTAPLVGRVDHFVIFDGDHTREGLGSSLSGSDRESKV